MRHRWLLTHFSKIKLLTRSTLFLQKFQHISIQFSTSVLNAGNNNGRLRLVGGTRNGEGRLEVLGSSGYWSSVCPDGWVTRNAGVTCQELCVYALFILFSNLMDVDQSDLWIDHFRERKYATSVPAKGRFGPITNPIRIFDTKCAGYENSLVSCPLVESWARNCYEDTAVGICCHSGCDGRTLWCFVTADIKIRVLCTREREHQCTAMTACTA